MAVPTISIADLRDRLSAGPPPVLIDGRSPAEFATVHARGATLMPLDSLDPAAVSAKQAAAGGTVYLLCHSGGRARKAAEALFAGVTDFCGMGLLLARMPWKRRAG